MTNDEWADLCALAQSSPFVIRHSSFGRWIRLVTSGGYE
jgi:hypothetical protein